MPLAPSDYQAKSLVEGKKRHSEPSQVGCLPYGKCMENGSIAFLGARRAGLFRHRKRCPWACRMGLPPADALRCDGRCRALELLMERAAMAHGAPCDNCWNEWRWLTERIDTSAENMQTAPGTCLLCPMRFAVMLLSKSLRERFLLMRKSTRTSVMREFIP